VRDATLCFLVRGKPPTEILLGYKKTGFGAGKWGGFGGKIEAGETVAKAAIREMEEETGVRVSPQALRPMGVLSFYFPARPTWSLVVYPFLASAWQGEPSESDEMLPAWYAADCIPYDQMWQDGAHWLPRILAGERIRACFTFGEDNESVADVMIVTL